MNIQCCVVRRAVEGDILAIARINAEIFLGHRGSEEDAQRWVFSLFRAFPVYQYFVAENTDGTILGYIGWQMHGGFLRSEPVMELEQVGVGKKWQGCKIGPKIISESMREIASWTKAHNNRIESHITFIVWVYAFNFNALKVYAETFGEGIVGMRTQYGNRTEVMLRVRAPLILPVRTVVEE